MSYLGNNNLPWDISRSSPIPTDAERFSGNNSTTAFTLTRSVNFATDLEVFVENIQQEPITAYTVNGNSVVFTEAPPTGTNNVYVVYRNYQSGAQVSLPDGSITYSKLANNIRVFTTDNFTANGNVSSYGLSESPADANTVFVTVDGVVQRAPAHYTTSGSTITFTSAPPFSANVHIRHLGFRTTSTVTALPANSNISQPTLQGTTTANGNFLVTNGSVILSPGSVSAPALSFSANTTTGLFMPVANTIAFGTAGTENMRIDSVGNVMINTTTSQTGAKLSVTGGIQGTITSGTAVASTSGTSIDFTSIPSWVKRVTVMFNAVSLSSNSTFRIRLGTGSTTYTTSGYVTFGVTFSTSGLAGATDTGGFPIGLNQTAGGVTTYGGSCVITNITGNTWSYMAICGGSSTTNGGQIGGGSVPLGAVLTAVRVTTLNGTDTFDAGSVNIMYEG
jgi:hypothetical protein